MTGYSNPFQVSNAVGLIREQKGLKMATRLTVEPIFLSDPFSWFVVVESVSEIQYVDSSDPETDKELWEIREDRTVIQHSLDVAADNIPVFLRPLMTPKEKMEKIRQAYRLLGQGS